jgi:hypothetical protein
VTSCDGLLTNRLPHRRPLSSPHRRSHPPWAAALWLCHSFLCVIKTFQKRLIAFFNAFYGFSPANPRSLCLSPAHLSYLFTFFPSALPFSLPCQQSQDPAAPLHVRTYIIVLERVCVYPALCLLCLCSRKSQIPLTFSSLFFFFRVCVCVCTLPFNIA